jgi:hypothetical protein
VPVLHEGVPGHLEAPLRDWISSALQSSSETTVCAALRLGITVGPNAKWYETARLLARSSQSHELLDIVDAILACDARWKDSQSSAIRRGDLAAILRDGSSAWRINDEFTGLTRRVDATAAAAATEAERAALALPTAGSAAAQLAAAWAALYELHPDPSAAYRDAIRAVESAAHAVIEPNNTTATLGTMLRQLRAQPQRYSLAIAGQDGSGSVEPLIGMLELLWKGQTSRHGAQTTTRSETWEEARMAVHLAVALVHWFVTGAVRRTT